MKGFLNSSITYLGMKYYVLTFRNHVIKSRLYIDQHRVHYNDINSIGNTNNDGNNVFWTRRLNISQEQEFNATLSSQEEIPPINSQATGSPAIIRFKGGQSNI